MPNQKKNIQDKGINSNISPEAKNGDTSASDNLQQNYSSQSSHTHSHPHPNIKNMKIAFSLNLFFTIVEFIGGFLTNSVAIMSDAIHDLGDSIAIGGSLYFEKYSQKGRDNKFSYGYKRFSPLAAMLNSTVLFAGSAVIITESIPRLINPTAVNSEGMFYLAIFGVIVNGAAVFRLTKNDKSVNSKAIMLHLLEDVLGWVAVLLGSIVIYYTDYYIIDPIMSLGIAGFILYNAMSNLKNILKIFLQGTPLNTDLEQIILQLKEIKGVTDIHDAHSWTLDGNYNILTLHIQVKDNLNSEDLVKIKKEASPIIEQNNFHHYTIEIEFEHENCSFDNC